MKKKTLIALIIVAPFLAMLLTTIHVYIIFSGSYNGENTVFTIKPGETFSSINYRLTKEKLISNPRIFHYFTKYKDQLSKFKAGTFNINKGDTMSDILHTFVEGSPILTSITIPEGKNIFEIGKLLETNGITSYDEFVKLARDKEILNRFDIKGPSLEGYLFPETYKFAPGTPAFTIIKSMMGVFDDKVKDIDFNHPFLSKHEVITLASIVEKETGAKSERPTIAGVFLNRLKKKMRLQSDPTTIYGIYENFNGNLRKKHLLEKTPFNTYKIPALPIGPISNPSIEAIKAVLKPDDHNFLYFVSKNDGTHIFTKTYNDHLNAVKEWQLNRSNRKGKSWRDLKQ